MASTASEWVNTVGKIDLEPNIRDSADESTWDRKAFYGGDQKTDQYWEDGMLWTGLGLPGIRKDMKNMAHDERRELGKWSYIDTELALATSWSIKTEEDIRQKGLGSAREWIKDIGIAMKESFGQGFSIWAARPLIFAFDATTQPMWDSVALCGTHTHDGGSIVNSLPAASITHDTIWDMADFLRLDQYTQKGNRKRQTPSEIVFHPRKARKVSQLKMNEYIPGTTTRDKMTIGQFNLKYIECIELDALSEDAWFMRAKEAKKNFAFKIRKKVTTEYEDTPLNRSRMALAHARLMSIVRDWYGFVGRPAA